ncbi:hypothetical protein M409DRAFT_50807 [Zasmidium cellare ATCC 36951]|uniref:Uncharacterized protein n=1 Tax=Zasmidium cellare ATCC 36951 TaxID=1080233 RepID=A0A6A6CW35_ZASCE|nr:uncharacterized protein M409DRAFT_50807 [Zasmidium cellare ATCC 36951]KAF2171354.1 hypothetical protein M409DRAFT_50807 [Zasmidium cellare ATCC 36951]
MSSSTTAMVSGSGDFSAGAMIPITRSFVQTTAGSAITTAYLLVGQVLDNGQTNWVGYDHGSADYLMTSSFANAQQTTLADGNTYYVSDGKYPAGYLAGVTITATSSGASETGSGSVSSGMAAETTSSSDSSPSSSSSSSDESTTSSSSGSAAAATTSSSSGNRLTAGVAFTLAMGLLAVFSL